MFIVHSCVRFRLTNHCLRIKIVLNSSRHKNSTKGKGPLLASPLRIQGLTGQLLVQNMVKKLFRVAVDLTLLLETEMHELIKTIQIQGQILSEEIKISIDCSIFNVIKKTYQTRH